jgi:hypothetical protein
MIKSPTRQLVRLGACALVLALGAAGDRITAQSALPAYEVSKERQIWQYGGHIGAGFDLEECFGGSVARRLQGDIERECLDNRQPDQMWEPTGFAVYQSNPNDLSTYRMYIADRVNQRIAVFGWETSLTGPNTPDGRHIATVETFASPIDTDGDGEPNTTFNYPESVSVDSAGNILVADSGNGRVVVLDPAFAYQYEISYATPEQIRRYENPFPFYFAVTPGTVVRAPGACNPAAPGAGRILVGNASPFAPYDDDDDEEDHDEDASFLNQIVVYDGAFCELSRLGTASLFGSSAPGEFNGFNGLAFDGEGRLFVGDYGNARVQAFAPTGLTNPADPFTFTSFDPAPVLTVEDAAPTTGLPIEPWGVMIDDRNRLVIAQPNYERLSVFELNWNGAGPIAAPAFALSGQELVQGAPHHILQDGIGRWLVSEPFTDRIDVFVTPDLAVFDQIAAPIDTGGPGGADSIRVEFSVATPVGKLRRSNVHPQVEVVPRHAGAATGLGPATGPFPSALPVGPGNFPDAGTDIDPGTYARWYFLFPITDAAQTEASFRVWATSGRDSDALVTAPSKTATTRLSTCVSAAPPMLSYVTIFDVNDLTRVAPLAPGGSQVYGPDSEIRISAADADGVASIHYRFGTSLASVDTLGNQASIALPDVSTPISYTIEYWAVDGCNVVSTPRRIEIYVDSRMNDRPVAVDDVVASNGAIAITLPASSLLANDSDPNNDPLTVVGVTQGAAGTVALNANGTITYTRTALTATSGVFTYTISDGHGRTATATVTVQFNRPPACGAATATLPEIWPPNHKQQHNVAVQGVTDPDGNRVTITITGIFQDEPVDSTGDGQFAPDGGGVGTATAWVRAERMGGGDGRAYEIRFTATDSSGGSCTGAVYTTVPHSKGQKWSAINSGIRYDSQAVAPGTKDKTQTHKNKQ